MSKRKPADLLRDLQTRYETVQRRYKSFAMFGRLFGWLYLDNAYSYEARLIRQLLLLEDKDNEGRGLLHSGVDARVVFVNIWNKVRENRPEDHKLHRDIKKSLNRLARKYTVPFKLVNVTKHSDSEEKKAHLLKYRWSQLMGFCDGNSISEEVLLGCLAGHEAVEQCNLSHTKKVEFRELIKKYDQPKPNKERLDQVTPYILEEVHAVGKDQSHGQDQKQTENDRYHKTRFRIGWVAKVMALIVGVGEGLVAAYLAPAAIPTLLALAIIGIPGAIVNIFLFRGYVYGTFKSFYQIISLWMSRKTDSSSSGTSWSRLLVLLLALICSLAGGAAFACLSIASAQVLLPLGFAYAIGSITGLSIVCLVYKSFLDFLNEKKYLYIWPAIQDFAKNIGADGLSIKGVAKVVLATALFILVAVYLGSYSAIFANQCSTVMAEMLSRLFTGPTANSISLGVFIASVPSVVYFGIESIITFSRFIPPAFASISNEVRKRFGYGDESKEEVSARARGSAIGQCIRSGERIKYFFLILSALSNGAGQANGSAQQAPGLFSRFSVGDAVKNCALASVFGGAFSVSVGPNASAILGTSNSSLPPAPATASEDSASAPAPATPVTALAAPPDPALATTATPAASSDSGSSDEESRQSIPPTRPPAEAVGRVRAAGERRDADSPSAQGGSKVNRPSDVSKSDVRAGGVADTLAKRSILCSGPVVAGGSGSSPGNAPEGREKVPSLGNEGKSAHRG